MIADEFLNSPDQFSSLPARTVTNVPSFTSHNAITLNEIGNVLFEDDSALLKHECAYCLGQMQDVYAIKILSKVLANTMEHPMVRHEAGEALGAIGTDECLEILEVKIVLFDK